jgi:hypothetical protein
LHNNVGSLGQSKQVAFLNQDTGECGELHLNHINGAAERFYRDLQQRGISVRLGMEATGYSRWFERLLAELGFEVWIGDPSEIKIRRVKKQKTDRKDASTPAPADAGRQLSANLGTQSGKSRSSATALASPSASANAHADHESAAGVGPERRQALEDEAVERAGASRVGEALVGALG